MAEKAGLDDSYSRMCNVCNTCNDLSIYLGKCLFFQENYDKLFQCLHISQILRTFACDNRILKLLHLIIPIYSLNFFVMKKI